ncbi:MAG: MFS transporter [Candidatus Hermodarchaeia archaeon]|jgi:MFS family permease
MMAEDQEIMQDLVGEVPKERRVVQTFGVASFLNDMGSDMVFAVWPFFVALLAPPGLAPLILGIVDGIGDFIVNISKGFSGFISDKIQKRKPFIWSGYFMGASSRIIYAFSPTWNWLVPAKILDRAGKLRGAPRDAMVADVSTHDTRGRNFGVLRTADHTGATAGILFALAFVLFVAPWLALAYGFDLLASLRVLFVIAAIPTLIGACIIFVRITDYRKEAGGHIFRLSGINSSLAIFMALSAIFALASFSWSLVTFYAGLFLVIPALDPIFGVILAYLIFTLAAALTSAPLGALGDRIGRRKTMLFGFIFFGAMCAIFLFTPNFWTVICALVFYGVSIGATVPMARSLVSELSPVDVRASILGLYQMLIGIAALPASVIAGYLWVTLGPSYTFGLALILTAIAALLLPLVHESTLSD